MTESTIGLGAVEANKCDSYPGGKVIILPDEFPSPGTVTKFSLYFAKANIIKLQIWRPEGGKDFSLVHEQEVDVDLLGTGSKEVAAPDVAAEAGDRLGVTVEEGNISIACAGADDTSYMTRAFGETGEFTEEVKPMRFAMSATFTA